MAQKGTNWFAIVFAIILLICGAIIFITFNEMIVKILGLLAAVTSVVLILAIVFKNKKNNIVLENEYNTDRKQSITTDENLGIDDLDNIKITNYKKVQNEQGDEIEEDNSSENEDGNEEESSSNSSDIKYKEVKEVSAHVRDLKTEQYREFDMDTSILLKEEKGSIIGPEPRKEFNYFVSKILLIIRALTKSKTVVFALIDDSTRTFSIESFVTNVREAVNPGIIFDYSSCIISQTIDTKQSILMNEVHENAGLDLLPYYSKNVGVKSVVTYPVLDWNKKLIGVISMDSDLAEAYSSQTSHIVKKFVELLLTVVYSYIDKYELLQSAKALKAIEALYKHSKDRDLNSINTSALNAINSIIPCESTGVCLFDDEEKKWSLAKVISKSHSYYLEGCAADLSSSIIGSSIMNSKTMLINIEDNSKMLICNNEPKIKSGSFLTIPISSDTTTYGAFYIINNKKTEYTKYEQNVLEAVSLHVALCIEKYELIKIIQNSAIMDVNTCMLNILAFNHRLAQEIQRAKDFSSNLSLCLFKIDKYSTIDWKDINLVDKIHKRVFGNVQQKLRQYDLFGTADRDVFGIVLIDYNRSDAKVWAESLRKDTASTIIEYNGKKLTTTISMGLTNSSSGDDINTLIQSATEALNEASKEKNKIVLF